MFGAFRMFSRRLAVHSIRVVKYVKPVVHPVARKIIGTTIAAAATIAALPEKKQLPKNVTQQYHDTATEFIRYRHWTKLLLDMDEKNIRDILGYLRYCVDHAPELHEIIRENDLNPFLYKIINADIREECKMKQEGKKPLKPKFLAIVNETLKLENMVHLESTLSHLIDQSLYDNVSGVVDYVIANIQRSDLHKLFLNEILKRRSNPTLFNYIKQINAKNKIVMQGYAAYAYKYEDFLYFAENNLIDPENVVAYMENAVASDENSLEGKRSIIRYLLALNPHPSVKHAMTLSLISSIQKGIRYNPEPKGLSHMINVIDYEFTQEESEKFAEELNEIYNNFHGYNTEGHKKEMKLLIEYLQKNHPKVGLIYQ
ncbi:MAG: hypothetical protein Harvfovirus73_4 [Harvfovirus sp.]|uniref:Uncharacterized protein n=1 Tax=Harvfovirus sp. TaxID=2487768 RepID=A0A3G5A3T4_9VIRU|nr:MAG: hypothetical protein Harvfovirus73_4 [Harvfovirus sp.]